VIPRLNVELACGHPFAVLNDWQPRLGQWITCRECQGQRKIVGWSAADLQRERHDRHGGGEDPRAAARGDLLEGPADRPGQELR
jgi:hypothetical protein